MVICFGEVIIYLIQREKICSGFRPLPGPWSSFKVLKLLSGNIQQKSTTFQHSPNQMKHFFHCFAFFLLFSACQQTQIPTGIGFKGYPVGQSKTTDLSQLEMLKPYTDSVDKTMNEILAENAAEMLKAVPNSTLGNFLADAYLWAAREKFEKRADVAFMNHGGVRINRIPAGEIDRRIIYEVMPFDNTLVIVELKGDLLQKTLDRIAEDGGGGGVAGLSMRIKDKKAVDVMIGGLPLDPARTYFMVNSDYAVDGGGGFNAFKTLPQQRTGYFQRDAIIEYCKASGKAGVKQFGEPKNRIIQ